MIKNNVHYKNGLIHYIYGNGAGKSTSSFGMALRAIGHGFKPIIIQFLKETKSISDVKKVIDEYITPNLNLNDLLTQYFDENEMGL